MNYDPAVATTCLFAAILIISMFSWWAGYQKGRTDGRDSCRGDIDRTYRNGFHAGKAEVRREVEKAIGKAEGYRP